MQHQRYLDKNKAIFIEQVVKDLDDDGFSEEAASKFAWEQDVERSWNLLVENDGVLQHISQENTSGDKTQRYKKLPSAALRKGVFRHVVILFDMSYNMKERDFKPDRINAVIDCLETFLNEFFYKNPVGQVGVVALKKSSGKLIQEMTSNVDDILESIKKEVGEGLEGSPSLQKGLQIGHDLLCDKPPYGTREIFILYGSIRTCDKLNILHTVESIIKNNIHVNCISIAPEMYILKHICEKTNGIYKICFDETGLHKEITNYSETPLWMKGMQPQLIHICFPVKTKISTQILCACHTSLHTETYVCNFCNSNTCKIPSKCKICGIYLISMQDLSHVSNTLQESPIFEQIDIKEETKLLVCSSCNEEITKKASQCVKCKNFFCFECDVYIHEDLNQCPFCIMEDT